MRTIKLLVEYEGAEYLGWQRQPQGMTVQQALEEALEKITGKMPTVIGAGRTDSGVHARGQAAHFKTSSALPVERLQSALNAVLPEDIVVLRAEEAPPGFHARYSARSRRYEYTIWNDPVRPALDRRVCWQFRPPLDMALMQRASDCLVGTHDFTTFASANSTARTTVRTVTLAQWSRCEQRLVFAIEANAFLYNMVRSIVGTLTQVGLGKLAPRQFEQILLSRDRAQAGPTAPPHGLCFVRVDY